MFPFFFLSSLFLRLNTEQQVRSLHKYLLRTWGGAEGLSLGRGLGQGEVPTEALPAGPGGGRGTARAGRGRGNPGPSSRSFPIPTRLNYRLPGPTAREVLRAHSLPLSPTLGIGKLRPRTTAKSREATRPIKVTRQASRSRTPGLIGSSARAPLSLRAEAGPEASASDPVWRDQRS